jgi:protein lifeguard
MASNTKYQPAPQSDPDDYTHAPPAYAEGSAARDETQGLFGAPRNSEDNLPDDFKVGTNIARCKMNKQMLT